MKFRILTDTHYEQTLDGDSDPNEVAQEQQAELRKQLNDYINYGDDIHIAEIFDRGETVLYVQPFDPGGMMFTDEFMREVIGIVRVEDFEIHANIDNPDRNKHVRAYLNGVSSEGRRHQINGYGSTMGFALRDVREKLREETGK